MTPEGRHVVVDGFRLRLLDWGGDAPDVLFLHGGALTAHTWDTVCTELGGRYRRIALDQRGHGDSEWSPAMDYGTDAHVRDLAGLTELLGLDRLVVVGQSMGAINGITFAARHPGRVAALVIVDAAPWVRREGAQRIADFVLMPAELDTVEEFVERAVRFNPRRDPEALRSSLLHNLRRLPNDRWTWKYDRRPLTQPAFDEMTASLPSLDGLLDDVRCPALVVRGAESDVLTDEDAARLAARLPDGRWTRVEGAGHTVQGDNAAGLAAAIRSFLADAGA